MSEVVDRVALKELLDIMGDVYPTLVSTFESDSKLRIQQMVEAVKKHDGGTLTRVAHTFKGSAGNVCAVGLADVLKQVEVCGKTSDFATAKELLVRVECLLIDVLSCLKLSERGG